MAFARKLVYTKIDREEKLVFRLVKGMGDCFMDRLFNRRKGMKRAVCLGVCILSLAMLLPWLAGGLGARSVYVPKSVQ